MGGPVRVVIVRHGESTFNVQRRIQGRLDHSDLTERGQTQAQLTGQALQSLSFEQAFVSPLRRAQQTAARVLAAQEGVPLTTCPLLTEVDLPPWEGLTFEEVAAQFPEGFEAWQKNPNDLLLAGRYPVRELWTQAQDFWRFLAETLGDDAPSGSQSSLRTILVVAHSGINRMLLATALGLKAGAYNRLGQQNCGVSVLNFARGLGQLAQLESMNLTAHLGDCLPSQTSGLRLLIVRHGETEWNRQQRFQGQRDIPLNAQGEKQAQLAASFLREQRLDLAFSSPLQRPWATAAAIASYHPHLTIQSIPALQEISHGSWEGLYEQEIEQQFPGQLAAWQSAPETVQMPEGENLDQVWERARTAWAEIVEKNRCAWGYHRGPRRRP